MFPSRSLLTSRVAASPLNLIRPANRQSAAALVLRSSRFTTTPKARANPATDPDAAKPTLDVDPFAKSLRLNRARAPHFTIYEPQLTWLMSIGHRVTGAGLGVLFYLGGVYYAISPYNSAEIVSYVHSLPPSVLVAAKVIIGAPLVYHSLNGVRHLIWDTGKSLSLKGVYNTGYVVLAGTVLGTGYLAMQ